MKLYVTRHPTALNRFTNAAWRAANRVSVNITATGITLGTADPTTANIITIVTTKRQTGIRTKLAGWATNWRPHPRTARAPAKRSRSAAAAG